MSCLERHARMTFNSWTGPVLAVSSLIHHDTAPFPRGRRPPPAPAPSSRAASPRPSTMPAMRECSCPRCSGGEPDRTTLVSERTWFYHNQGDARGRRDRGRKRPRAESDAGPAEGSVGGDAQVGGGDSPEDAAGSSAAAATLPAAAAVPPGPDAVAAAANAAADNTCPPAAVVSAEVGVNGVCIPHSAFCKRVDSFVAYSYIHHHRLTRAAASDYLKQRSRFVTHRTPRRLSEFVRASVDLHERRVDCCSNGCVAFVARRAQFDACDVCGSRRLLANGIPAKKAVYWSLSSWLLTVLADPVLGRSMTTAMADAIKAAKSPSDGVRDWYDGKNFREAVAAGLIDSDTCVALSISMDGFEAWRQRGFQGWPIVVTVLSVEPNQRVKNIAQFILAVTPGPRQPADLESFLHPIAEELDQLAQGISGVKVAGRETTSVLRAFVLQFTTDMPGGDKLLNAKGCGSIHPGRFRVFMGVRLKNRYCYPPVHPANKKRRLFSVQGPSSQERSATSLAAAAEEVEAARRAGNTKKAVNDLAVRSGIKGYSLFHAASPEGKQRYPNLGYLWTLGQATLPYDTMHLLFCNVVPLLWELFSGGHGVLGKSTEPYIMSKATVKTIGLEIAAGCATVPLAQARSLRDINVHSGSYKAADWLYFLLSVGEVVLADRLPEEFFKMFMHLSRAGRLLFRPSGLTEMELTTVEGHVKNFCAAFYKYVYAGRPERVELCRLPVVSLLDIVKNIRTVGPVWSYWQFPIERLIGTLPELIGSHSEPYASLVNAITRKYQAQLVTSYAETYAPQEWGEATGKPVKQGRDMPNGAYELLSAGQPSVQLLPPRHAPAPLTGMELGRMREVLELEGVADIPQRIVAKKYCRLKLVRGQVAGSTMSSRRGGRRDNLVRVESKVRRRTRGGGTEDAIVSIYGAVHHYAVVFVSGRPMAFAFIECVVSSADRHGKYGLPENRRGTDCFTSLGGRLRYVDVQAIDAVVGTLEVRTKHVVLFCRDRFSHEQ